MSAQDPAALYREAVALWQSGRGTEAEPLLRRAVAARPAFVEALQLLGMVLGLRGDREGAERVYRQALQAKPDHAETHYNLATLLHGADRLDESIAGYRRALQLRRAFPEAHVNLANALKARGRVDEALAHYADAVRLNPRLPTAVVNYGVALREAGRAEEAIAMLERGAGLAPQSPAVHNDLGIAYFWRNRFLDAERSYRRALEIAPAMHQARNNLANALAAMGRQDEAIALLREVVAQVPGDPDAYSNLGVILQDLGQTGEALAAYEKALGLRPDHPDAINNAGYLLQEQGRRRDAMALYQRALAVNPGHARAAYNLALAHLAEFEFEPGWRLHEERYRTVPPIAIPRPFAMPVFSEADWGKGYRLAVWREQGVGDQLLYSTLLPELEERGQEFVLELDARLIPAFRRAHPSWTVVSPQESAAAFAGCDRHAALGSLARWLRPTRSSFAQQPRAFLRADPARAASLHARLETAGERIAGISWRSFQPAAREYVKRKKSAPLEAFLALSRRDDLRLLDLQYGDTAAEREAFARAGGRLERFEELDLFNDLDGVLAAVEACDFVLTTSNVTAHFAGALGKRTLLVYLAANPPFHYWVPDASGHSLWYPSVEIVTGTNLDTWDRAFAKADERIDS